MPTYERTVHVLCTCTRRSQSPIVSKRQRQRWVATEPIHRYRAPHATNDDKPEQRRNQSTHMVTVQHVATIRVVPEWKELN